LYSRFRSPLNSSLLGTYYFGGDDYFQFDISIAEWFATRGIWRIVGIPSSGWLVSRDVYAFALIAAHAIGGYFFFLIARRGFGSVAYALFLAIIVVAFSWGFEALVWASAAAYGTPTSKQFGLRRVLIRKMALTELWTLAGTNGSCSPHKVRSALDGAWKSSVGIVAQRVAAVSAESDSLSGQRIDNLILAY